MTIRIKRLSSPSIETLKPLLDEFRDREPAYAGSARWSDEALAELPEQIQAFAAYDSGGVVGVLLLGPGVFELWGARTDLLGANPLLPACAEGEIHTALLIEAKTWASSENLSGLEILLPMGPTNMHRDDRQDTFYEGLGFERFYYTMTRELDLLDCRFDIDSQTKFAPTESIPVDELFKNFAGCLAHGEIEFMTRMSRDDRREYFTSLAEETTNHQGSLALMRDDQLLGFALVAAESKTIAHLAWIGVLPEHRSKGLGRKLLCSVMDACRKQHIGSMSLYTDTDVGAQTLYHGLSFSPAGALTYRWRRTGS
ncbi:GNAT family N-acetyltransferase [Candidatus Bipolaricaulota bacterium]